MRNSAGEKSLKPFDDHRCIFVHIPKTGGVSVSKSLFGNLAGGHMTLEKYKMIFSESEFDSYFKFTFVRNPWDRLVSAYTFLKSGGMGEGDKIWAEDNLRDYGTFDDFVKNWLNNENIYCKNHFVPQSDYICVGNAEPEVDFIGYFEKFQESFDYVCHKIGIQSSLGHLNATQNRKKDYRDFYTTEIRNIVGQVYQRDIELFGYDFNNQNIK
jgi:hypothetical protein